MDVEDSWSAFAPVAFDAVVLVHVPDPVQPQQSKTSLSSQAVTAPSSCALLLSTPSSFDSSPTCSHVVKSSPSVLIDIPDSTFFYFICLRPPKGSVERAGPNFRVDSLLRVVNDPVQLRPFKAVLPRRLSSVEESCKNIRFGFFFPIA